MHAVWYPNMHTGNTPVPNVLLLPGKRFKSPIPDRSASSKLAFLLILNYTEGADVAF